MKTLVYVTQNPNKLNDVVNILSDFSIEHVDFDVAEIQSMDGRVICEHKLKEAYNHVGKPCFVTDVSFGLDCLDGFPGPLSRWWNVTVGHKRAAQIAHFFGDPGAQFKTVLGYYDGKQTHFWEEVIKGIVAKEARGTSGYEWDVIFIPEGATKTFAEMSFEEKHQYTPTSKLLNQLRDFLISNR